MTNDLFIEDDGRGDPTLWETNGQRPIPLCSQSDVDPIAWRLIEGALTIRALHTPVRSDRLNLDLCIRCREVHPCRTITALSFNEHHQGISEGNQMTKNRGDDEGTYDDGWEVALEPIRQAARHPHKGPADTDASMLLEAASRIERGGPAGGSHTTATVSRVLRAVAERVSS